MELNKDAYLAPTYSIYILMAYLKNVLIKILVHLLLTSIIVYADDIILISLNDLHLQTLLNCCSHYGIKCRIKFNPLKSNVLYFGKSLFSNRDFILKN